MSTEVTYTPEIPDDWWKEAGMDKFVRASKAYPSSSSRLVLISEIEPPRRAEGKRCFERDRIVSLLKGFIDGAAIDPIEVGEVKTLTGYKFKVMHGMHRFYSSLAAGFECIPVVVKPYFDITNC